MNRKDFLKSGALASAATLITPSNVFAKNLTNNAIDKLVDTNGNFIQQPLPYAENFLEPYMDSETLHLHYTFHHGGATKAANTDLKKLKKLLIPIILKLLTIGQKIILSFIFSYITFNLLDKPYK